MQASPQLGTSVFIIPGERVKNDDERLVVLNRIAINCRRAAWKSSNPRLHLQGQADHADDDLGVEAGRACGLDFRRCECMTSNIPSGAACELQASASKIGSTSLGIVPPSPHTILPPNSHD